MRTDIPSQRKKILNQKFEAALKNKPCQNCINTLFHVMYGEKVRKYRLIKTC